MAEEEPRLAEQERFVHWALIKSSPPVAERLFHFIVNASIRNQGRSEITDPFEFELQNGLPYSQGLAEVIDRLIAKGVLIRRQGNPGTIDAVYNDPEELEDEF